jgi:hypothetical protein
MSTSRQFVSLLIAGTAAPLPGGRATRPSFPVNPLVNSLIGAGLSTDRAGPPWTDLPRVLN